MQLCKLLTFEMTCWLFMSIDDPGHVRRLFNLFPKVTAGFLCLPIDFPGTTFNRAVKASKQIRADLAKVIKQRRSDAKQSQPDLVTHLLASKDEDGKMLSENEIADIVLGLLIASHDTSTTVMASVVYFLADYPEVYAKVVAGNIQTFLLTYVTI